MVAVVVWCVSRVAETVWWKLAFVREPSRRFGDIATIEFGTGMRLDNVFNGYFGKCISQIWLINGATSFPRYSYTSPYSQNDEITSGLIVFSEVRRRRGETTATTTTTTKTRRSTDSLALATGYER
uniref:Uncharacterized protein n=1 Tax=Vespula pensylvanica TaxID=30213 RepID=A0A834NXP6_VESPE|nr:hypothetical protein H0235_010416 [Vespula pensylvanica]